MYCPQCGIEASAAQQYCRSCGANLKVIAKAVTLSEAIARSDRGPLPKIKEVMKGLHIERTTEEVTRAIEQMNREIIHSFGARKLKSLSRWKRQPPTPEQRRERALRKGVQSLFTGVGLSIFLYYFAGALVLHLPPDVLAKIPFELEPVVRVIWLVGAIPVFSGLGQIISGLLICPSPKTADAKPPQPPLTAADRDSALPAPDSVTDHTTELLH